MASNGKSNAVSICPGPIKRREFLRIGLSGFATLSLPGLFELRARAAIEQPKARTAVILVWLRGGASHLETYDPARPPAISWRLQSDFHVSGHADFRVAARHAKIADKFHCSVPWRTCAAGIPARCKCSPAIPIQDRTNPSSPIG
jgi:hypothetical protein